METQSTHLNKLRPLHLFDGELGSLHSLLLEMAELLIYQMEQTLHALDFGDVELALKVIARDRKVNHCRVRIDREIQNALGQRGSLACDLKTMTTIAKMTDTLEKIGNEISDTATIVQALFSEQNTQSFDVELMAEIIHIGGMIKIMLNKMTLVLETRNSNQAYKLMQYGWNCDTRLQLALKQQLIITSLNEPGIDHTLTMLNLLKTLERCAYNCRNMAEYQILMLDSIDMRSHSFSQPN